MTESQCLQYCYDNGYDFDGFYEHLPRLSCWCCPLQKTNNFRYIKKERPDLWEKLRKMQDLSPHALRLNFKSVYTLEHQFWLESFGHKNVQETKISVFQKRDTDMFVENYSKNIVKFTKKGDIILDLLGEDYIILLCCETIGRIYYGVESDPEICAKIITRWEQYTDREAKLIGRL